MPLALVPLAWWNLPAGMAGRARQVGPKLWAALLVPAALSVFWVMLTFHLIRFGTHY